MKNKVYLIIFIISILSIYACNTNNYKRQIKAWNGVLNLRNINFKQSKIIALKGQWEFYWEKKISDSINVKLKPDTLVNLPSLWNNYSLKGKKLENFGYASYRLTVWFKDTVDAICFKIQDIPTSSELYVNKQKIYSAGKFGKSKKENIPGEKPSLAFYTKACKEIEIILLVANYNHRKGGPIKSIEIGSPEVVTAVREKEIGVQLFLFGALFIMGLYHIGLYWLRKKERSPLFFAAFSISIGIYTLITGETFIKYIWINAPWEILLKLEYIIIIWAAPFFLYFLKELYSNYVNKVILRFNLFLCISLSVFVIISDPFHYSKIMPYYHYCIALSTFYCISILIRAIANKDKDAKIFLIGLFMISLTIIHDIILNNGLIHSTDLVPYGFFLFILSQAYILSAKFSKAFVNANELKIELEYMNKNLEGLVVIRTAEINQQKIEITEQKDEIIRQKNTLTHAVKLIEKSNKDMTDSIRYARKIQQAAFPSSEMIDILLPDSFIYFKPKDIVSGDFYWIRQNKHLTYIAVADCTGHGVPGGFMSMLGIAFLNEISNKVIEDASLVLEELRRHLKQSLRQVNEKFEQKDGLDIAFCILNIETNVMQFSGANRNIQLIRDFKRIEIKGDRMPIGVYRKERPFVNKSIQLELEDVIYLFSDGYTSQFGGDRNEKFKNKRMNELLYEIHQIPMFQQRSIISHTMDMWRGENSQIDDILILGFRIH